MADSKHFMEVPLLHIRGGVFTKRETADLLPLLRKGEYKMDGREDASEGEDGEGEFKTRSWQTPDRAIIETCLTHVQTIPDIRRYLKSDSKGNLKYTRAFVWRHGAGDHVDKQETVFRWHRDGAEDTRVPLSFAVVFVLYDGDNTNVSEIEGAEVRLGIRKDNAFPTDVLVRPKQNKVYEYTTSGQYVSLRTPHNSMYLLAGGHVCHAVQEVQADCTRYAVVFFFQGQPRMREHCKERWFLLRAAAASGKVQRVCVECPVKGCTVTFLHLKNIKRHVENKH